jgi:hypothetical protein
MNPKGKGIYSIWYPGGIFRRLFPTAVFPSLNKLFKLVLNETKSSDIILEDNYSRSVFHFILVGY